METTEVVVLNIGLADAAELRGQLQQKCSIKESSTLDLDKQGDLSVVDLAVQFGPPLIGILGLWLMKPRKGRTIRRTLRVTDKNGRVREETLHFDDFSSESPKDSVVKALSSLFGISKADVETKIEQAQESGAS